MEIIDISRDILKTPVYPGDPEGYLDEIKSMKQGEKCNLNAFYTCLHTATHIDAPLHFINGGSSIDEIPFPVSPLIPSARTFVDTPSIYQYPSTIVSTGV